ARSAPTLKASRLLLRRMTASSSCRSILERAPSSSCSKSSLIGLSFGRDSVMVAHAPAISSLIRLNSVSLVMIARRLEVRAPLAADPASLGELAEIGLAFLHESAGAFAGFFRVVI